LPNRSFSPIKTSQEWELQIPTLICDECSDTLAMMSKIKDICRNAQKELFVPLLEKTTKKLASIIEDDEENLDKDESDLKSFLEEEKKAEDEEKIPDMTEVSCSEDSGLASGEESAKKKKKKLIKKMPHIFTKSSKMKKSSAAPNNFRHHKCKQCSKSYSRKNCLLDHILHKHARDDSFECPKCPRSFKTCASLEAHDDAVHEGECLLSSPSNYIPNFDHFYRTRSIIRYTLE